MTLPTLMLKNFNGYETLVNKYAGYAPYFSSLLRYRVNSKRATNIVVTGEPGEGKSYQGCDMARVLEGCTKSGRERFSIDQVVFTFRSYMDLILHLPMGRAIVFDEPSYAMGKRDWYKEINKVLVLTIESQRFKVHPLFIPIINKALLDKTIRSYLIQFQVEMRDRGKGVAYRIKPSQHSEKVYRYFLCNLDYGLFDNEQCEKPTCLGCETIMSCNLFRAQYERKKGSIQEDRYEEAAEMASAKESTRLTDEELIKMLSTRLDKITNSKGEIEATLIRIVLKTDFDVRIGINKGYYLRTLMKHSKPKENPIAS